MRDGVFPVLKQVARANPQDGGDSPRYPYPQPCALHGSASRLRMHSNTVALWFLYLTDREDCCGGFDRAWIIFPIGKIYLAVTYLRHYLTDREDIR